MDSLPSPASSPEDSSVSTVNQSRKRARSASSDASSSKRAMSEDPSQAVSPVDAYTLLQNANMQSMHIQENKDDATATIETEGMRKYRQVADRKRLRMLVGETRYIVAQSWYSRWEKACTGMVDKDGPVLETELGPVDNSEFLNKEGSLDYNSSLIEDVDVQYVDQITWDLFKKW